MTASIHRVTVVGCGLIGAGWATWFLAKGLTVTCTDAAAGIQERLGKQVAAHLSDLGHAHADRERMLARLRFETDLARAVANADWIQENVAENLALKRMTLADIDEHAPPEAVIASSTSSLKVSDLQFGLSRPDRIVAGHPFLPVTLIPLVEVAGGSQTSPAAMEAAMEFYRHIGKRPVRLRREITGHIANRLQAALMREAFFLLQQGVASASDIDLAITAGPGQRWVATGPIVSHQLAGGEGGARQAFANLGDALRTMWADLGSPRLTSELEAIVIAGAQDCLAEKSQAQWAEERRRMLLAVQREKALLNTADSQ